MDHVISSIKVWSGSICHEREKYTLSWSNSTIDGSKVQCLNWLLLPEHIYIPRYSCPPPVLLRHRHWKKLGSIFYYICKITASLKSIFTLLLEEWSPRTPYHDGISYLWYTTVESVVGVTLLRHSDLIDWFARILVGFWSNCIRKKFSSINYESPLTIINLEIYKR